MVLEAVASGAFDLDDISTMVGEDHGGHRAGDPLGAVDDTDAFECSGHEGEVYGGGG